MHPSPIPHTTIRPSRHDTTAAVPPESNAAGRLSTKANMPTPPVQVQMAPRKHPNFITDLSRYRNRPAQPAAEGITQQRNPAARAARQAKNQRFLVYATDRTPTRRIRIQGSTPPAAAVRTSTQTRPVPAPTVPPPVIKKTISFLEPERELRHIQRWSGRTVFTPVGVHGGDSGARPRSVRRRRLPGGSLANDRRRRHGYAGRVDFFRPRSLRRRPSLRG